MCNAIKSHGVFKFCEDLASVGAIPPREVSPFVDGFLAENSDVPVSWILFYPIHCSYDIFSLAFQQFMEMCSIKCQKAGD